MSSFNYVKGGSFTSNCVKIYVLNLPDSEGDPRCERLRFSSSGFFTFPNVKFCIFVNSCYANYFAYSMSYHSREIEMCEGNSAFVFG